MASDSFVELSNALDRIAGGLEKLDPDLLRRFEASDAPAAVACGSTALGLAAAARDLSGPSIRVLRDPTPDSPSLDGLDLDSLLLGVSFSGASTEVPAFLRAAANRGMPVVYASAAEGGPPGIARARLDLAGVPRRFLPLAACLLLHRLRDSASLPELRRTLGSGDDAPSPALAAMLESAYRVGLAPVFISTGDSGRALTLATQYMEFLKRPAFHRSFPGWTHDFLWALGPADGERFAVIHLGAPPDLADGRFADARDRLGALGIRQLAVEDYPESREPWAESRYLARSLLMYRELAVGLGLDSDLERGFR